MTGLRRRDPGRTPAHSTTTSRSRTHPPPASPPDVPALADTASRRPTSTSRTAVRPRPRPRPAASVRPTSLFCPNQGCPCRRTRPLPIRAACDPAPTGRGRPARFSAPCRLDQPVPTHARLPYPTIRSRPIHRRPPVRRTFPNPDTPTARPPPHPTDRSAYCPTHRSPTDRTTSLLRPNPNRPDCPTRTAPDLQPMPTARHNPTATALKHLQPLPASTCLAFPTTAPSRYTPTCPPAPPRTRSTSRASSAHRPTQPPADKP